MKSFSDFGLAGPIMQALATEGHETPTPIQISAIPPLMAGRDLVGIAQTGTGKTAAFALPILHRLAQNPAPIERGRCRVLVLTPTRELASQVLERFNSYGRKLNLKTTLVIGGSPIVRQLKVLRAGVDILVATPGRLVDIIEQGALSLDRVEMFVLDEVDQMLDLGFIHAIRAIARMLPARRQNIFLSATMPPAISKLAAGLLRDPVRAEIQATEKLKIDQSVLHIEMGAKPAALVSVVKKEGFTRGLVFTRTKHGADKVVRNLTAAGAPAFAIHGNRSQAQREKALGAFRDGRVKILVATDIAARGLDISEVSHVVNYDLPNVPETYVHRIGRTARAGAAGVAISFCSSDERPYLRSIERLTQEKIAVANGGPGAPAGAPAAYTPHDAEDRRHSGKPGGSQNGPRNGNHNGRHNGKHHAPAAFRNDQPEGKVNAADAPHGAGRDNHGERRAAGVRRSRNGGSAGRKFSRAAG